MGQFTRGKYKVGRVILEKQGLNPHKRIDELEKRIEALEQLLNERKQTKNDSSSRTGLRHRVHRK